MREEDSLYTKISVSVTTGKVFNEFVNSMIRVRESILYKYDFTGKKIFLKIVISLSFQDIHNFISNGIQCNEYRDSLQSQLSTTR